MMRDSQKTIGSLYCLTISIVVIPNYRMLTSYLRMFTIDKVRLRRAFPI